MGDQLGIAHHQETTLAGDAPQRLQGPDDLVHLAGAAVVGPVKDGHATVGGDAETGLDLAQVGPAVLGMAEARLGECLFGHLVGAEQADRGHVPVDAGHVEAEGGHRPGTDRADDAGQLGGHRVEGSPDAVVVERVGRDAEDLLHRPRPGPVLHVDQRCGRSEAVGHQRFDDLAVSHDGQVANRAGPVDDVSDVEASAERRHHRQRTQRLVHTGRAVPNAGSHTTLFAPTPRFSCKEFNIPSISSPTLPTAMCGGRG